MLDYSQFKPEIREELRTIRTVLERDQENIRPYVDPNSLLNEEQLDLTARLIVAVPRMTGEQYEKIKQILTRIVEEGGVRIPCERK